MSKKNKTGQQAVQRFINRELSWLDFNHRVLEEGLNARNPILERLKFLSIFSSNLDEFYMVRVGGLCHQRQRRPFVKGIAGMTAGEQMAAITQKTWPMVQEQYTCLMTEIFPELKKSGLARLKWDDLDDENRGFMQKKFHNEIFPLLTPLYADGNFTPDMLKSLELNLLVELADDRAAQAEALFAVVPVPARLDRILYVDPGRGVGFVFVEDLIKIFLHELFPGYEIRSSGVFRITRDADMSVDEENDEDFIASMSDVLKARGFSEVVRIEIEEGASDKIIEFVSRHMKKNAPDTFLLPGPLDLKALMKLTQIEGFDGLREEKWVQTDSAALTTSDDLWETLAGRDVLLYHPYERFDPVVRFVSEAALDENVLAIKMILYRTSPDSAIIKALKQGARNGKEVTVLVELKARFDEERNIRWARELREAGARVIMGLARLKTHAKATLVIRREHDRIRRYVHLGTGNYNEATARVYTDLGLLSSNPDLGSDISAFFNAITGYSQIQDWRLIDMAPSGLRRRLVRMIRREVMHVKDGLEGRIVAKMNALADREIIEELYAAGKAGVKIDLVVRGICCLRAGVRGLSENIRVRSVIDRFLEHPRIYCFRNGGNEEVCLSSADCMARNLDKRVELIFPLTSDAHRKRARWIVETAFEDSSNAWILNPDDTYTRVDGGRKAKRSQETIYRDYQKKNRDNRQTKIRELKPRKF